MANDLPRGLWLRLRRLAAGLRQVDVAHAIGVSATYLSAVERGEICPNEAEVRLLDHLLPELPSTARTEGECESAR